MKIITSDGENIFPPGLVLYRGLLKRKYASKIYSYIQDLEWNKTLSRDTIHYGYAYDYSIREPQTRKLKPIDKEIPDYIKCLADALYESGILTEYPNQIIINKYEPGQGIAAHRDHNPIFGDSIATISLGSGIMMDFEPYREYKKTLDKKLSVYLKPGDILVFAGDARLKYSHEIKKKKSDIVDGVRIPRDTRISITFRHVNKPYRG